MARILLIIAAFIGTTVTQQMGFDAMRRPLFEIVTAPPFPAKPPPSNLMPFPTDQHGPKLDGVPPLSSDFERRPNPPIPSQQQQMFPSSLLQQVSSQRAGVPTQIDLDRVNIPSPKLQKPPVTNPFSSQDSARFRDIFNNRIRAEGFEFIERRFTATRRKRSQKLKKKNKSGISVEDDKEFITVKSSTSRFSDSFPSDMTTDDIEDDEGGGSGDFSNVMPMYPSSTKLHRESGYKADVTKISNRLLESDNRLAEITSRMGVEETEEPKLDEEGSAISEDSNLLREDKFRDSLIFQILGVPSGGRPAQESNEETNSAEANTEGDLDVRSSPTITPNPSVISSNSIPLFRDSKLLRVFKENIPLILGTILGIPAIVVLCYFVYLKRLKRFTGTLDVTPHAIYSHKKPSRSSCSKERELACSPSTSKIPQPPPFSSHPKKHIP